MTVTRPLCADYSCPARVSCARHILRSVAYRQMDENVMTENGPRDPKKDACEEYKFDRPKKWLALEHGQVTHIGGDFPYQAFGYKAMPCVSRA